MGLFFWVVCGGNAGQAGKHERATCERAADPRLEDGSVSCPRSPGERSRATEPIQQLGGEAGAGATWIRMRNAIVVFADMPPPPPWIKA